MFKFCPKCGKEMNAGWACCPYCGFDLREASLAASQEVNIDTALDDALDNLFSLANEQQAEADKLRVYIIREMYDDATKLCNQMIERNPMDKAGYVGLIRIASKNYTVLESEEIDKQIRMMEQIFTNRDELLDDPEYAEYVSARNEYFAEKERKRIEAERKRIEAEKAEAERKRIEAEKAEAERKRIEAERKRIEEEKERKRLEQERINKTFDLKDNGDGTFTLIKLKDSSLTNIIIPNNVTNIGNYAFMLCNGLTSVMIPDGVMSIGDSAFFGCRRIISVTIPNSVKNIGSQAFDCTGLRSVTIPKYCKLGYSAFPKHCNVIIRD